MQVGQLITSQRLQDRARSLAEHCASVAWQRILTGSRKICPVPSSCNQLDAQQKHISSYFTHIQMKIIIIIIIIIIVIIIIVIMYYVNKKKSNK